VARRGLDRHAVHRSPIGCAACWVELLLNAAQDAAVRQDEFGF
jgi:hypothetical protein